MILEFSELCSFLEIFLMIIFNWGVYVHEWVPTKARNIRAPESGVTDSSESSNMAAGNHTQVLWKRFVWLCPLSHLSGLNYLP